MNQPLVTIMMPFLNAGVGFAPALRSILEQTYSHWELLLCDDGSTDGSLEFARGLRDPRVKVWSDGRTKGLASRLNECIDTAAGSLLARMDADDISYPRRLAAQVDFLAGRPEIDVLGCPMLIFGEDGVPLGQRPVPADHAGIVAHPASGFGLAHPTWMARAAWFRRFRYDAQAVRFEDIELLYRSYRTSRFANLPEILYAYREPRGGFRKRLKTRYGRLRYLRSTAAGSKLFYHAAAHEAVKVAADAALALTGTRYAMLRRREAALTSEQSTDWRDLYLRLGGTPTPPAIFATERAQV